MKEALSSTPALDVGTGKLTLRLPALIATLILVSGGMKIIRCARRGIVPSYYVWERNGSINDIRVGSYRIRFWAKCKWRCI